MSDLVSIIMPTYNRAKIVARSIKSMQRQTYENWELIVVDDMSNDDTLRVIQSISERDSRVHYFKNTHRKGPSGARNTGLEKRRGKYVAFLDSDDEWCVDHLEESLEALEKMEASICFSLWIERTNDGKELARFQTTKEKEMFWEHIKATGAQVNGHFFKFGINFFEYVITHSFFIYHINGLVIETKVLDKIGYLDENLKASEDTDLIFRLFSFFPIAFIDKPHFYYNQGEDNLYLFTNRKEITLSEIINNIDLIEKISFCSYEKCKMLKKRLNLIKEKDNLKNKELCKQICKAALAKKYFTLSFLNYEIHKGKAIQYQFYSCIYDRSYKNFKILLLLFSKKSYKKMWITKGDIDIT